MSNQNNPNNTKINPSKETQNALTNLLNQFGYTNPMTNQSNPDLNVSFNELLSKLTGAYKEFGLPQAPSSVMEPAFGKNSINDITKLYQKVYLPAIDNYAKTHSGDQDTLQLLRFFGLIQLILFRSLSMVDMYSLLRSKYEKRKMEEIFQNISGILNKISNKGVEVDSYKQQIDSYKKVIDSLASKQPIIPRPPQLGGKKINKKKSQTKNKTKK
jgi:hypothetical protein